MTEQQSSYRQILKATSIFGGVQVFNIVIQIAKSKVVAVLLGPSGMGVLGLLTSSLSIIGAFTNFGLHISAVKDISEANQSDDNKRISIVAAAFRRIVWVTGMLGTILTVVFSSTLSQLSFGNKNYTLAFIWISITLLFTQLTSGQLAILQGIRKIKWLAQANLFGNSLSLLLTIPLYYVYGINGIVPGIIVSSLSTLIAGYYYTRKAKILHFKITLKDTIHEGLGMVKMGFMISLSGILTLASSYLIRVFISNLGGIEQVGLFSAGFSILISYVGLILNAMGTDYYPRLSAVSNDNKKITQVVNNQAEVAILLLGPIIVALLVFAKWIIILLYSNKFVDILPMVYWASIGMLFRSSGWAVAYIFLAKSDSKIFFWNELIASIYTLGLNMVGYKLFGLTGLGISFLITYILYFGQVYLISYKIYNFRFLLSYFKLFIFQLILAIISFLIVIYLVQFWSAAIGILIIAISLFFSYLEMNKRVEFVSLIRKKFKH
ncbi:MAG: O-antigen translocase [Bacteroidetes bacterium]|nr:O-antigen translocase [Bacteroidota bacterium]MBU1578040.1 O-antigen translocase [Bacteroidota bacterium]